MKACGRASTCSRLRGASCGRPRPRRRSPGVDVPIGLCERRGAAIARSAGIAGPGPSVQRLHAAEPERARRHDGPGAAPPQPGGHGPQPLGAGARDRAEIREVDAAMTPALQRRMREVHPELVFASLSPAGRGLAASKKTEQGHRERVALLPAALAAAAPSRAGRPFPAAEVALDDYVDALAALVTAGRLARGEASGVPKGQRGPRRAGARHGDRVVKLARRAVTALPTAPPPTRCRRAQTSRRSPDAENAVFAAGVVQTGRLSC